MGFQNETGATNGEPAGEMMPPVAADEQSGGSFDDLFNSGDPQVLLDLFNQYGLPAIKVILLVLVALIIASWVKRMVVGAFAKARVDETLSKFLGNLARWTILILAGIAILGIFGIPVASFAAIIAAMGLAIGLALQGTLGNLAAGVMLLIFRPFKVGQVVEVNGVRGKVFEIELFSTTIDTVDNRRIIVPNGNVFGSTIENVSHHATRRVDLAVGVDYSADIDRTRQVLTEAAASIENVLKDPEPAIVLTGLGDSSVNWAVRVWVNSGDFFPVLEALTREVKYKLDAAEIGIPFPQMDVHIDGAVAKTEG